MYVLKSDMYHHARFLPSLAPEVHAGRVDHQGATGGRRGVGERAVDAEHQSLARPDGEGEEQRGQEGVGEGALGVGVVLRWGFMSHVDLFTTLCHSIALTRTCSIDYRPDGQHCCWASALLLNVHGQDPPPRHLQAERPGSDELDAEALGLAVFICVGKCFGFM